MLAISQVVNGKHFHKSTVNLPVSEEWVQQLHKIQLQLTILTKQRGVKNVQKSNSSIFDSLTFLRGTVVLELLRALKNDSL